MKRFIGLLIILFLYQETTAQTNSKPLAYSGSRGIYLWNFFDPCAAGWPAGNGAVKVNVSRRSPSTGQWELIHTITMPDSSDALRKDYNKWAGFSFDPQFLQAEKTAACYQQLRTYKKWDSAYYFMLDPVMALACGRMWIDTTAHRNTPYEYRLMQLDAKGNELQQTLSNTVSFPGTAKFEIPRYHSKKENPGSISLSWSMKPSSRPAYFRIFRRAGLGGYFEEIHPLRSLLKGGARKDSLFLTFNDEQVAAEEQYYYYIQPCDEYMNIGLRSDTVLAFAFSDRQVLSAQDFQVNGTKLSWRLEDPSQVASIEIYRSISYKDGYQLLTRVSPQDSMYVDEAAIPKVPYYYYLRLVDKLGHHLPPGVKVYGLQEDKTPPGIVPDLRGTATASGIKLNWESAEQNIGGFYVYRSDGTGDSLRQLSGFISADTTHVYTYVDRTATPNSATTYAYAILQENTSHVSGILSPKVYVRPVSNEKAVIYPPANVTVTREKNNILLLWEDADQFRDGITGYNVYRKMKQDTGFILLSKEVLPGHQRIFKDSLPTGADNCTYAVQSVHIGGSKSSLSPPVVLEAPLVLRPEAPAGLHVHRNPDGVGVVLNWDDMYDDRVKAFKVYRMQKDNKKPVLLSTLRKEQYQYEDKNTQPQQTYFYFITAVNLNDLESAASAVFSYTGQ